MKPTGTPRPMRRRLVSSGVFACALSLLAFAGLPSAATRAQPRSDHVHYRYLTIPGHSGEPERVVVTFPRRADRREHPPSARYPLLVALHGYGETKKGSERGALGWPLDYALGDAFGALSRGTLEPRDYGGFVTKEHVRAVNDELRARPFEGVMVVAPYVPDLREAKGDAPLEAYASWVAGPLLEAVRERFPAAARTREGTGIDGVSLGGKVALEVALRHPATFGAAGAIQPAIVGREASIAERAAALKAKGTLPKLRIVTSEQDSFRASARELSTRFRDARIPHVLINVPGPHGYAFNRGPGAIELLRFADRGLVREPLPSSR